MPLSEDDIKKVISKGSVEEVMTLLFTQSPLELALLNANSNFEVKARLASTELAPFWVNKFNKLRLKRDSSFQFRIPDTQSRADFYCGYVLYLAAIKEKSQGNAKYEEYLTLSQSKFNSFHAIQEVLNTYLSMCKDSSASEPLETLFNYLARESSDIQKFKTPGCLLLANSYFYLATFYQKLGLLDESIVCYRECWKHLHGAKLLEKDSTKAIHNAYFGQGLIISNPFGLTAINTIKDRFLEVCSEALPYTVRHAIETQIESILCSNSLEDPPPTCRGDDDFKVGTGRAP